MVIQRLKALLTPDPVSIGPEFRQDQPEGRRLEGRDFDPGLAQDLHALALYVPWRSEFSLRRCFFAGESAGAMIGVSPFSILGLSETTSTCLILFTCLFTVFSTAFVAQKLKTKSTTDEDVRLANKHMLSRHTLRQYWV